VVSGLHDWVIYCGVLLAIAAPCQTQ
jgi:hypothetical protein